MLDFSFFFFLEDVLYGARPQKTSKDKLTSEGDPDILVNLISKPSKSDPLVKILAGIPAEDLLASGKVYNHLSHCSVCNITSNQLKYCNMNTLLMHNGTIIMSLQAFKLVSLLRLPFFLFWCASFKIWYIWRHQVIFVVTPESNHLFHSKIPHK